MSEKITAQNIDDVVKRNFELKDDIQKKVDRFLTEYNYYHIGSKPQIALAFLKEYGLLQMPVEDSFWSGAIFVKEGKTIPVINTALPRANQYFAAWHEIYHIVFDIVSSDHFVETETTIDERKADYFASLVLLSDVLKYYSEIKDKDFVHRVFYCMSAFQVPYKAVLVSLYENAVLCSNDNLKNQIKECFDRKFDDISEQFRYLGLDDSLVQPSFVVNCDYLKGKISQKITLESDLDYHKDNEIYYNKVIHEIRQTMR